MWMNLDQVPVGKSMFTIGVTSAAVDAPDDERWLEEYDLVFDSRASAGTIITYATSRPDWPYTDDVRVVGVSDQSNGYIIAQDWAGIL